MSKSPLVVVLDLDETLIHTSSKLVNLTHYNFDTENEVTHVRSGAFDFVKNLLLDSRFRVLVWTAANESYANHVVSNLGFSVGDFERVWSSKFLNKRELDLDDPAWGVAQYRNEKDLLKVRRSLKTSLKRVVAVDDDPNYYRKQYSNQVVVPRYTGQEDDLFPSLFNFLVYLYEQPDVRPVEKRGWLNKSWN